MATENIIFKVLFDTTDATKQVASLDGVMENATKQVDEFTKNVKGGAEGLSNLAKAKKTFNDISIAESTNEIKELSAELSNATAKEKDFGKAGKETVDAYKKGKIDQVQATKQLGEAIDKGVVATQKMAVETEKMAGKMKSYKAQISELKAVLPTLSGEEYVKAQAKLSNLTDAMGDQQAQIKLLASDTRALDTTMQGLQLGVGVFAGLQGASALFGEQSADVEKALLKVNGAMAVLQSLQAIQNTLDAESGFVNSVKLYWKQLLTTTTIAETTAIESNILATEASTVVGAENTAVIVTQTASTGAYGLALAVVQGIQTRFAVSSAAAWAIATGGLALLVAGVVALALAFRDSAKAQDEYAKSQKLMNDVRKDALNSIVDEKVKLSELLKVANDEYKSKSERRDAIKKLNEISPEYLGNLTLENIKTVQSTTSIGLYLEALNKKAMAEAMYNKRVELNKKLIDEQSKSIDENITLVDKLGTIIQAGGNARLAEALNAGKGAVSKSKAISLIQDEINKLDELGLAQERQANFQGKLKNIGLGAIGAKDKITGEKKEVKAIARVDLELVDKADIEGQAKAILDLANTIFDEMLKNGTLTKQKSKELEITAKVKVTPLTADDLIDKDFEKKLNAITSSISESIQQIGDEDLKKVFQGLTNSIAAIFDENEEDPQKKALAAMKGILLVTQGVTGLIEKSIDNNIANFDKLIDAQKGAIDRAKEIAEKGNAQLLEAEMRKMDKLEQLRKEEGKKKKALAITNAIVNTAVAVTQALGAPFAGIVLAAIAAAMGAVQIGIIASQTFAKGGFTGNGIGNRDNTGHIPVGIVHDNEFVMDKEYTSKNRNELEYIHKNRIPLADIIKNNQMPVMSFNNILGGLQVNSSGQLEERMRAVESAILDLPNRMPQTSRNVDSRGLSIKMTEISAKEKNWKR